MKKLAVVNNNKVFVQNLIQQMFRNSYLQTYKNAILHNKQADFLFVHLSQIYATLGSVISDLEYQFSLMLTKIQKNQFNQVQMPQRNSINVPKLPLVQHRQENQFEEIQNKLMNYASVQKKTHPQNFLDLKPGNFEKEARNKSVQINYQQSDKRTQQRQSSPYHSNVIDSTQDFDALFLNPKDQAVNTNSNSRVQPAKTTNRGKQSTGNQQKPIKKLDDSYLDKLFGN